MIVYGDPGEERAVGEVLAQLSTCCARLAEGSDLDAARELLIQAGRLEQGIADVRHEPTAERLTDAAAAEFLRVWRGEGFQGATCAEAVRALESWRGERVYMKVPEGFAFYTLYPEQYALGVEQWARATGAAGRRVLVVGIRSIGTTLSAVVAATLRQCEADVQRITVRPTGHPYDRHAAVERAHVEGAEWGLIVDEGPGRSGSSFVAVARALAEAGMERAQIVFFPGHGGMPGEEGSEETRRWWRETRRVNLGMEEVRWGGRSLWEELAHATGRTMGARAEEIRWEDLSGGRWREVLGVQAPGWGAFERTKYRALLPDGRAALWKFGGVDGGAARAEETLHGREAWTARCIGRRLGFVGTEWVEGSLLRAADLDGEMLAHLGHYLGAISTARLPEEEAEHAVKRLREMARCNAGEALGEGHGNAIETWAVRLGDRLVAEARLAPDGRMGPWEWVRRADGTMVKVDAQGHGVDHTCVGRQPLWWDVAGAAVEWEMTESQRELLAAALGLADAEVARWYCAAYAAFRIGMSAMCGIGDERYREQFLRMAYPSVKR